MRTQVFFYIDPEFATDPKMNDVNNLILSYTFFKVEEDDEEKMIPQVKTWCGGLGIDNDNIRTPSIILVIHLRALVIGTGRQLRYIW
mgnify:FL=1